jgi:hypothetical protein
MVVAKFSKNLMSRYILANEYIKEHSMRKPGVFEG